MLLLVAWLRYRVDYQRPWGIVAAVALGLGVTSAPLFYSGLLTFVVAWLLHWLVGPVFMVGDEELQRGFGRRNWLPMGVAALATAVVVGSFFFLAPAGWGATAEIAADWLMQFGFSGGVVTLVEPILLLIRYEPILVLLSVVAIIWAVWGNRPFGSLLSYWLLAGLVLVLFQNGVTANALVLTLPAFLLLGRVTDLILNTISSFWAWIMTGVVLLFGALVLTNVTRFLRVARNDPNDVSHLYLILIAIVVLSVVAYYIWAVDDSAVLPGFWLGLMIFLLVYQWGTAWWLTHGPVQDLREAWVTQATDDDLPVMMDVLRNISRAATNSDNEIDILSTVEDPVLRWYLRNYEDATFAATLPTATTASVVITPIAEAEPPAGTDYFGSDFGIFQKYESLTPQNASSILDTLRWWLFHEAITPIEEERIILWVRADLTQTP